MGQLPPGRRRGCEGNPGVARRPRRQMPSRPPRRQVGPESRHDRRSNGGRTGGIGVHGRSATPSPEAGTKPGTRPDLGAAPQRTAGDVRRIEQHRGSLAAATFTGQTLRRKRSAGRDGSGAPVNGQPARRRRHRGSPGQPAACRGNRRVRFHGARTAAPQRRGAPARGAGPASVRPERMGGGGHPAANDRPTPASPRPRWSRSATRSPAWVYGTAGSKGPERRTRGSRSAPPGTGPPAARPADPTCACPGRSRG